MLLQATYASLSDRPRLCACVSVQSEFEMRLDQVYAERAAALMADCCTQVAAAARQSWFSQSVLKVFLMCSHSSMALAVRRWRLSL